MVRWDPETRGHQASSSHGMSGRYCNRHPRDGRRRMLCRAAEREAAAQKTGNHSGLRSTAYGECRTGNNKDTTEYWGWQQLRAEETVRCAVNCSLLSCPTLGRHDCTVRTRVHACASAWHCTVDGHQPGIGSQIWSVTVRRGCPSPSARMARARPTASRPARVASRPA